MGSRSDRERMLFEAQMRTGRGLRRLAGGSIDGRAEQAAPLPERPRAQTYKAAIGVPYMVFGGGKGDTAVVVAESADYELRRDGPLGVWVARLATAGTTTTTVLIKLNGSTVTGGTVNLGSGVTRVEADLSNVAGLAEDRVRVATTAAGTGALGLSVMAPIV